MQVDFKKVVGRDVSGQLSSKRGGCKASSHIKNDYMKIVCRQLFGAGSCDECRLTAVPVPLKMTVNLLLITCCSNGGTRLSEL